MNLKRIFGLYLPLALVASLVIPLTVEVIFSAGNLNLMVRNIFSFEQAIPDFEWEGKEYLDVSYSPDYETDCLDLYVPTSNTKPKLITLIHGGGFLFNDSRSRPCRFLYQYFRAKGYACASINYRLATESTFPGAVEDCKAAIKFLKLNADYYGYDASKMVVWGESAGGYLATMLSVINDEEFNGVRFEGQNDSNINTTAKIDVLLSYYGLINFDLVNKDFDNLGVWPLLRYFAGNVGDDDPKKSYVGSFLGKRIKDLSQEELDNVTPNTRINENIYNKDLKVFIAHGTADITVPILQSIRLAQDFSAYLGKENVTYKEFKNFRHGDDKFYKNEGIKVLSDYLENVLS